LEADLADEDLELVEKFQNGDITAFDLLVNKYQKKIYDIVYYYVHDVEDSYDLSQEIFGKVFKSLDRFRKNSSFYTWLYSIAINACIDHKRKRSRFQTVSVEEISSFREIPNRDPDYSPDKTLELEELRNLIDKAIEQLPSKQKAVFILKRYEELSIEEIARVLGRSEGTVKAHLFHATHKLMELLGPYLSK
jgi:RNA polymerase sigma-70 factor (ECF subfamily)